MTSVPLKQFFKSSGKKSDRSTKKLILICTFKKTHILSFSQTEGLLDVTCFSYSPVGSLFCFVF